MKCERRRLFTKGICLSKDLNLNTHRPVAADSLRILCWRKPIILVRYIKKIPKNNEFYLLVKRCQTPCDGIHMGSGTFLYVSCQIDLSTSSILLISPCNFILLLWISSSSIFSTSIWFFNLFKTCVINCLSPHWDACFKSNKN